MQYGCGPTRNQKKKKEKVVRESESRKSRNSRELRHPSVQRDRKGREECAAHSFP